MTKRNGKQQHFNVLVKSTPDDYNLAVAVEERFIRLCNTHQHIKGVPIQIPKDLDPDILRWRQLVVRHRGGDFRHTEAERQSTKAVAEWSVRENAVLRNQKIPNIEWED